MSKRLLIAGMTSILLIGGWMYWRGYEGEPPTATPLPGIETRGFLDPPIFQRTVAEAKQKAATPCAKMRGGLVNHHVLASDLLAQFFAELARCRPEVTRLIIISPDHYQQGRAPITTFRVAYQTAFGEVTTDVAAVQRLRAALPFAGEDAAVAKNEHGVAALVPYAAAMRGGYQVVPVMVDQRLRQEEAVATATWLRSELERPGTVVVVSSDMSHYLHAVEAKKFDALSVRALTEHDESYFWRATDDATDNGKGIWIALHALAPTSWQERGRGISSRYLGSDANTTTYITGWWE